MSENDRRKKKKQNKNLTLVISVLLFLLLASLGWGFYKNGLPKVSKRTQAREIDQTVVGTVKYLDCFVYFNQKGLVTKTAVPKISEAKNKKNISVEDLPYVENVPLDFVRLGESLDVENASFVETVRVLNQALIKNKSIPDRISCQDGEKFSLFYGNVKVELGKDYLLEEKLNRMFAILPSLVNLQGTLHLEDFEKNTRNIMFEKTIQENTTTQEGQTQESFLVEETSVGQAVENTEETNRE